MTTSLILRTTSTLLLVLLALFSVFALLRGHDEPGGGFVGGLLFAGAIAIRSLSHGARAARELLRVDPAALVALGLVIAAASALAGPVAGRPLLSPVTLGNLPGLGEIGSVLFFDIGVYLVVAGTALRILLTLSEEHL